MSLEDLQAGTFSSEALRKSIDEELLNIEQIAMADLEFGRRDQAKKKQWLVDAIREYMRLTDNEIDGRRATEESRERRLGRTMNKKKGLIA